MGQQFLFAGHAGQIKADHLVRPKCRLAAGPQADQHASDDRAIRLDLDPLLAAAEQMPATEDVLEEAKEDLDRPTVNVNQCNGFRRHVEQVGTDPQQAVAARPGRAAAILAAAGVWANPDGDQANLVIRTRLGFAVQSDLDASWSLTTFNARSASVSYSWI